MYNYRIQLSRKTGNKNLFTFHFVCKYTHVVFFQTPSFVSCTRCFKKIQNFSKVVSNFLSIIFPNFKYVISMSKCITCGFVIISGTILCFVCDELSHIVMIKYNLQTHYLHFTIWTSSLRSNFGKTKRSKSTYILENLYVLWQKASEKN